jgi:hypothetical protein
MGDADRLEYFQFKHEKDFLLLMLDDEGFFRMMLLQM